MDFLRAASIVAVVFGHWFISINHWEGGVIRSTSAIGVTSGLWLFTWVFQVMPIFFFVGGFSNLVAYDSTRRKGRSTWTFIRARLERLLRPSIVFLGIWAVVQVVLHLADVGAPTGPRLWGETTLLRGMKPPGATIPFGPLWFLGVYLVVVVIAPVTIRLHRRFGLWVPLAMALGAVVVDVVAFSTGRVGMALAQCGVRAPVPAPARARIRRRDVRPVATPPLLGDGRRRTRGPGGPDDALGVPPLR